MLNIKEVILFPLLRPLPRVERVLTEKERLREEEYIKWIKAGKPGIVVGATSKTLQKMEILNKAIL